MLAVVPLGLVEPVAALQVSLIVGSQGFVGGICGVSCSCIVALRTVVRVQNPRLVARAMLDGLYLQSFNPVLLQLLGEPATGALVLANRLERLFEADNPLTAITFENIIL